ncbi:MAG: cell division protein FtsB [Gammaproteobacteria bacterium]|nr:cell division protein FtsB [Gammaproteobacteria bacterium]MDH3767036.1 cell division protein FtsB [Gammaproteobacteria bacterium]
MRIMLTILSITLLALMYRFWLSDDGIREVWRLEQAVAEQQAQNEQLRRRNSELEAEVADLKGGSDAIEERARAELGMTRENETFYNVVENEDVPE